MRMVFLNAQLRAPAGPGTGLFVAPWIMIRKSQRYRIHLSMRFAEPTVANSKGAQRVFKLLAYYTDLAEKLFYYLI